ncbi:MAG TPA: hypothetical protein VIU35_18430 [Chitinophagaceae bacterium]
MEAVKKTAPAPAPAVVAKQPNAVVTPILKYIRPEVTNALLLAKLAKSRKLAQNNATTKSAAEKIGESEKAQNTPPDESQSESNQGQVAELQRNKVEAKTKDESSRALQEGIRRSVPTSLEAISGFKNSGKSKEIGKTVMQTVNKDVADVKSGFGGISKPKPPAPAEKGIELPPMEQAQPVENINLGAGVIPPVEAEVIDNSKYQKDSDDLLKKEEVSQEQLDMVDKGDLAEANKERKNLNKEATAQPAAIKQMASSEHKMLNAEMNSEEKSARADMQKNRQNKLSDTGTKQDKTKTDLEKKREEVAKFINNRYEQCQKSITTKLEALEKNSLAQFDAGQEKATKEFEEQVNTDINRFKTKRYDRFGGSVLWLKDKLCGIDDFPEVKQAFDRARADFEKKIDTLIATITKTNNEVIAACKKELEDTKTEIAVFVSKLGPQLLDIGRKAQAEVGKKLQALSADIDSRKEKLQQKLADKRKAAMEAIDKKIAAMKEAMSGLLSKIGNFLLWAAKKFFKWALEAAGVSPDEVMGIIDKGIAIIKAIVTKPIVFVKNLIKAASTGFQNFGKNFLKHLKDAIFNWLTGALEGVKLPQVWDVKGILMLVLDILGLTYQALRKRMVDVMGETVVVTLEKTFTLVKTLVTEGPAAAWEQMKEMADEMKTTFIDAVKSWIQTTIIYKAIETVVSLFIPGAGIIKAIIAIYDTVMFFIQKAKDIAKMIGDFLGSIGEIAMGNIAAAANALEGGLAKALALVINFLARFLRLSGITDKIRKVIETIRAKVGMVLDKIVAWIKKMAGKVVQAGLPADPNERLRLGMDAAVSAVNKFAGKKVGALVLNPLLAVIKTRYGFQNLTVIAEGNNWSVIGEINPKGKKLTTAQVGENTSLEGTLSVEDVIKVATERGKFALVTSINETMENMPAFSFTTIELKENVSGRLLIRGEGTSWQKSTAKAVPLDPKVLKVQNQLEIWAAPDIARKILNFRYRNDQRNEAGKEWEHIIENSTNFPNIHSYENLALTTIALNRAFNEYFSQSQGARPSAGLPSTGALKLRDYLKDKGPSQHKKWKEYFYKVENVSVKKADNERGKWQYLG